VHQFLDEAVVGVAGPQTAIGDAIGLAIKQLRQRESTGGASMRQSVLILLTDGGNDAGVMPPLQAAQLAAQTGLRIFTIGVGAAEQQSLFGLTLGNSDLDVDLLQKIASITGGEYFRATDAAALSAVYRRIDELEPVSGDKRWLRPAAEWFTWPLGLALLLSLPAAWLMAERM
jgi:Ca-activated chloride channel homolog